jgi:hypothetical protein
VPKHLQIEHASVFSKIQGSNLEAGAGLNSHTLDIGVPDDSPRSIVVVRATETGEDIERMQERETILPNLVVAVRVDGLGGETKRSFGLTGKKYTI